MKTWALQCSNDRTNSRALCNWKRLRIISVKNVCIFMYCTIRAFKPLASSSQNFRMCFRAVIMATITPHIVIFKVSDYNLVWLLKDVTFTATHTSDSDPSDCFQRQMHCDEIMYSADVCSFNGDICQSATLGIILCTLYFNARLWKDLKPSADINTSNMTRAKHR